MKTKPRYDRVKYIGEYSSILRDTVGTVVLDMAFGEWIYSPDGIEETYVVDESDFFFTQDSEY